MYEMFLGPLEKSKPWNTKGLEGLERFLKRVWRLIITENGELTSIISDEPETQETLRLLHETIKKVTDDVEHLRFNTAISQLMILCNELVDHETINRETIRIFILLLSPFAPHIGEELWLKMGGQESLAYHPWPEYDTSLLVKNEYEIPVQVNGKLRDNIVVKKGCSQEEAFEVAKNSPKILKHTDGKSIVKIIFIKNRILNIVVK
jgi:leucyl-tRNA synthetase